MTATEMIQRLQELVAEYGDMYVYDENVFLIQDIFYDDLVGGFETSI